MTARRRPPRPATAKPVPDGADPSGVLLEEIRSQIKVVIEAVQGTKSEMNTRFDAVDARFDRVETRLERVEIGLDRVETRLGRVEIGLERVETEVRAVRQDVAGKAHSSLLVALDQRVTVLERRLG